MYLSQNLKTLRKQKQWTQQQLAERVGIKRSLVGAYEEGRAEPKLDTLLALSEVFQVTLDQLVSSAIEGALLPAERSSGKKLRVLTVATDGVSGKERVSVVPVKAAAGYLGGYGDIDFIEALPQFSLPLPEFAQEETRRVFQIQGDSMLPILPGSYAIASYIQDWRHIKSGELYVFLTQDQGVVFKRGYNFIDSHAELELHSDNAIYEPYRVHVDDIIEVWRVQGVIQWDFDAPQASGDAAVISRLDELQKEVRSLRHELGKYVA